jgi:hypothetical protein
MIFYLSIKIESLPVTIPIGSYDHNLAGREKHGIKVGTEKQPLHITSLGRDSYRPYLRPAKHQVLTQTENMNNVVQETISKIKGGV